MESSSFHSRIALASAGLILLGNVVVPLVWGDIYPFTSAPMFRDAPRQCCSYRVLAADGRELVAEDWLIQRVYDGNPLGYGVGVRPPEVIEQEFGVVHEEGAVHRHIEQRFAEPKNRAHENVELIREVIGPIDSQHVGVVRIDRWRITRP